MKRKSTLSLDLFGDRLDISKYYTDDRGEHQRMLKVLTRAIEGELTPRQRECVRLRYVDGLKVKEVAEELGVTPPTACKHLKKARLRLEKVMKYSFPRLN